MKDVVKRIRISAWLVAAGLAVQCISLTILHPLAFVAFILAGCPLVAVGMVFFLLGLLPSDDQG